jgi:hypothetical protein
MINRNVWGYVKPSLTHGPEPFFRSCQLCSHSRTSQNFMEHEGLLRCSQEPSSSPYHEPDQSNLYHPIPSHLSEIHFNIVRLLTPLSSQCLLPYGYPNNILYAFHLSPFVLHANLNKGALERTFFF